MLTTRANAASLNNIRRVGLANGDSTGANCRFASRDMRTLRECELSILTGNLTERAALLVAFLTIFFLPRAGREVLVFVLIFAI